MDQKGGTTDTAKWRTRTFVYNSLSQLLSATNPESGAITYTYDVDGNLVKKVDARGVVTCFGTWNGTSCDNAGYDVLHRVTKKSYSDGTPAATFTYDVTSVDGLSILNPKGRLVKAATGNTRTVMSYDVAGRVKDLWQCTPANCGSGWFQQTYAYNLASLPTSQSNPMGFTLTHGYDAAARLTQTVSSWSDAQHPATLVSMQSYHPHGALKKYTYGNGLVQEDQFNNRLQPTELRAYNPGNGANTLKLNYGFGTANNGNVMSWSAAGAQAFSRSYTYDELNRLKTLSAPGETCAGLSWTYDIWANRTHQTVTGGTCGQSQLTIDTKNRIVDTGFSYDAAGNMTAEPGRTYQYDAENRMVSVNNGCGGSGPCYVYDANGRRVRKTAGGVTTDYIYDAAGQVVAERQGSTWTKGYVYLGAQLLAQYDGVIGTSGATTYFVHKDHLGSTRVMTKVDKSVHDSMDYLPYGEQIAGDTGSTHKFTGQERDSESGLDYFGARYYASISGRFMTPDPLMASARIGNPQTWNRYSYVLNNPLRWIDPDGMEQQECKAQPCRVTVKVNVIYDKNANRGKGLTEGQKKQFERKLLERAKKQYGNARISLDVSYSEGSVNRQEGTITPSSLDKAAINVVVTDEVIKGGTGGVSYRDKDDNYITIVSLNAANDDTLRHELAHHFLGHTSLPTPPSWLRQITDIIPLPDMLGELDVDTTSVALRAPSTRYLLPPLYGSHTRFRHGARKFSAPSDPEANKPRKD